jgi:hypothetical protein
MGSFTAATGIAIFWVLLSSFCYGCVAKGGLLSRRSAAG